jgi:mono/diheme cytochrome c family protein
MNSIAHHACRAVALSLLILVVLASVSCRSVRRGEPIQGKLDASDSAIARGERVFAQNCHACHPGGEGGLGPGINDKPFPKFLMKTQVRRGLGTMPSFDKHTISPEELDDLMKYIVALRRHNDQPVR